MYCQISLKWPPVEQPAVIVKRPVIKVPKFQAALEQQWLITPGRGRNRETLELRLMQNDISVPPKYGSVGKGH